MLAFSGVKGMNVLMPQEFDFESVPPNVVIDRWSNLGITQAAIEKYPFTFRIKESELSMGIELLALNSAPGQYTHYSYALENDGQFRWVELGRNRQLFIQALAPGNYKVWAACTMENGQVSDPIQLMELNIVPFFYKTWWFWLLTTGLFISLSLYINNLHQKRKRDALLAETNRKLMLTQMRQQIASDLHDDLGADITRLTLLARQLELRGNNGNEQFSMIAKLGSNLRDTLSHIIWSTDPKLDDVKSLILSITEYGSEMLQLAGIEVKFEIHETNEAIQLNPQIRQNVWLMVKEIIQNCVKHSKATEAFIRINQTDNFLKINIEDNGRGIDFEAEGNKGRGLENLRYRAEKIDAYLSIESEQRAFTKIGFKVIIS